VRTCTAPKSIFNSNPVLAFIACTPNAGLKCFRQRWRKTNLRERKQHARFSLHQWSSLVFDGVFVRRLSGHQTPRHFQSRGRVLRKIRPASRDSVAPLESSASGERVSMTASALSPWRIGFSPGTPAEQAGVAGGFFSRLRRSESRAGKRKISRSFAQAATVPAYVPQARRGGGPCSRTSATPASAAAA